MKSKKMINRNNDWKLRLFPSLSKNNLYVAQKTTYIVIKVEGIIRSNLILGLWLILKQYNNII